MSTRYRVRDKERGRDKTRTDRPGPFSRYKNFYLLTIAAVAKELNRRGMRNADVLLSVGLPLTRFGAEKQDFIDYLSKKKEVAFRFEKERYAARIARVSVFPQCYAAVVEQLKTLPGRVVADVGSWTIDIMPIENGKPNEEE